MTKKQQYKATCTDCNVEAICPNCGKTVDSATDFSLWLREQKEIDSSLGFVTTNVDYLWRNYLTGKWMLIEEKTHSKKNVEFSQNELLSMLDKVCKNDPNYKGRYLLVFEKTSPDNGKVWMNHQEINRDQLISFLMFKWAINN